MNKDTNGSRPEGPEAGASKVGQILREARQAAQIDVNKICADLRISPQALEALEQGHYHLLPGDPYIRALLGSLARYLSIDPQVLIRGYNEEIGVAAAAPSIAPYTDSAQTHKTAHKQIFIVIVIALFVVLFLLIGHLNKGESTRDAGPQPAITPPEMPLRTDSSDTAMESKSLAPDSAQLAVAAAARRDSLRLDSLKGKTARPAAPAVDSSTLTKAVVRPLVDSVWIKVLRSGKEQYVTLLRLGKQVEVSHLDTITVVVAKRKSVEVTLGDQTVIPDRKRFKIFGKELKTF